MVNHLIQAQPGTEGFSNVAKNRVRFVTGGARTKIIRAHLKPPRDVTLRAERIRVGLSVGCGRLIQRREELIVGESCPDSKTVDRGSRSNSSFHRGEIVVAARDDANLSEGRKYN